MKAAIAPIVLGGLGAICLVVVHFVLLAEGDVTTPRTYSFLSWSCMVTLLAGMSGVAWALISRKTSAHRSFSFAVALCSAVSLVATWTWITRLPSYVRDDAPMRVHSRLTWPNKSLQPMPVGALVCNSRLSSGMAELGR